MKTIAQLTDTMNTCAAVYDLAMADYQRTLSGAAKVALEKAIVARRNAAGAVDDALDALGRCDRVWAECA